MNDFRFANPMWLCFAAPLFAATWLSIRHDRRRAVLFSSVKLLDGLPRTYAQRLKRALPWLHLAGMLLIVIALARPQAGLQEFRVRAEGIAMVMCIDRSGSMEALDFELQNKRVNRLAAVKQVIREFVVGGGSRKGRPDDLIGLIAFGGFAESKMPLTLDHGLLLKVLDSIEIPQSVEDQARNIANRRFLEEERATAIGDAVTLGVERLKGSESKSKVIVLLSDGENTAGVVQPEESAKAAAQMGIKIYAIGVGSTGQAPFPAVDAFGRTVYVAQSVRLDEKTLRMLADTTGGQYFNAQDTQTLAQVYGEIDKLEKTMSEGAIFTDYRELFQWTLIPGVAVVVFGVLLRLTRFRCLT